MAPLEAAINDALRRLAAGDRALLELSHRREVPDSEIGTLLGLATDEVRARRDRILLRVAADVEADAPRGLEQVRAVLREPDGKVWTDDWNGKPDGGQSGVEAAGTAGAVRRQPRTQRRRRLVEWTRGVPGAALLLLPGGLTAYLGFNAGGFFAGDTATATVVVCFALLLRVTLANEPLAGLGRLGVLAVGLLAAFAAWTLLSAAWSDAPARALIEFDRALLYLVLGLLFATIPRSTRCLRVMLWGFAGAAAVVCLVGLASRVLPDVVSAAPNGVSNERLAYPVTYWNALGMLAALGLLACFHIAAAEGEPRMTRVLGAAAVPGLAVTLFFTFSRGAIAVVVIALVAYAAVGRPRGLLSALVATVPPSVVALVVAYGADMLATENPTAPTAAGQADRVALVTGIAIAAAALLRLALVSVDARLSTVRVAPRARRALIGGSVAVLVLGATGGSLALDAPAKLERHYDRFVEGREVRSSADARRRLTDPANNGRLDHWRVALDVSRDDRLKGHGAGTYEIAWAQERPVQFVVRDAHSLYIETLAELGIVGLALLGGALLVLLAGLVRHIRGPDRALYAALAAMAVAWLLRAGVDWDWEMPVITVWLFALGGAVLARPEDGRSLLWRPPRLARIVIGLLVLALALTPALIYLSQHHIDRSAESFRRGDCTTAVDRALEATSVLSVWPEPFEILGYCDTRLGRPRLAVRAMEEAVERDPEAWELRYGLALVRAAARRDPRPAARSALRLNPRSPLAQDAVKRFRTDDPQKWRRRALSARLPVD